METSINTLEKTAPILKAGAIRISPNDVRYVRDSDKHETIFNKDAGPFLHAFIDGKNIQAIILENFKYGKPTDFVLLKDTLLSLYWSNNLVNGKEFSDAIEFSDWLPVNESVLIRPTIEIDIGQGSILTQILLILVPVAVVVSAYKLFNQTDPSEFALLLLPAAFLSLKGILSATISSAMNKRPQILSLQISKFGIYANESSSQLYELPTNQTVIKQNDLSDSLWVVVEGECRAANNGVARGDLKSGDIFGEIGVIFNTRRTATIFTVKPSILLKIEATHMYQILSSNLNLAVDLQTLASERLDA